MSLIDPARTWVKVEQRLEVETDAVLRRNLETILQHMKAEAAGVVDELLATLSEDVHYHSYGNTDPALNPQGKAAVRRFYDDFIASGATRLQLDVDRLVVDNNCVVTEGVMRMAYPGRTLAIRGIDVDDLDAYYLYETRMAILWPMDDEGKVRGEDSYTSGDGFAGIAGRKLRAQDIRPLPASR